MKGFVLCHLCHAKMNLTGVMYQCPKCGHEAEAILPPTEAEELFKAEIAYKESLSKRGGGSSKNSRRRYPRKRGVPWYDIDRMAAEGSPGQGLPPVKVLSNITHN